uniref:EF-hand domain-containing protein n=2 Tax=Hemiselmis andersenii TaxID=464988 RepID=A0A7S0THY7_HEMAN
MNPARVSVLLGLAALLCLLMVIPADSKDKAAGSGSGDLADVDGEDLLEGVIGDKDAEAALDDALGEDDEDGEDDLDGDDSDDSESGSDSSDEDEEDGADTSKALRSEIEFFKEHDKDGDGHLTLAEYKAAMNVVHSDAQEEEAGENGGVKEKDETPPEDSMLESDFAEEDANKDGKLSLDEWLLATFHEEPQDEEEANEEDEEDEQPMTAAEIAESRKEAEAEFGNIDTNKDGHVTEPEMLAYVRDQEKKENAEDPERIPLTESEIVESVTELFGELDTDKDGKVFFPEFFEVQYDVPRARQDEKPSDGDTPKVAAQAA